MECLVKILLEEEPLVGEPHLGEPHLEEPLVGEPLVGEHLVCPHQSSSLAVIVHVPFVAVLWLLLPVPVPFLVSSPSLHFWIISSACSQQ